MQLEHSSCECIYCRTLRYGCVHWQHLQFAYAAHRIVQTSFDLVDRGLVKAQESWTRPHILSAHRLGRELHSWDRAEAAHPLSAVPLTPWQHTVLPSWAHSCAHTSRAACRINRAAFTDIDEICVTVSEDGFMRRWDVATGKLVQEEQVHDNIITDMQARFQLAFCAAVVAHHTEGFDNTLASAAHK